MLDAAGAERLAAEQPALIAPAEDVSYAVVERFFARCEVRYDTVFLRWDKTRTAALLRPEAPPAPEDDGELAELVAAAAGQAAGQSVDWWRRVGRGDPLRRRDRSRRPRNEHLPHPLAAYAAGDPRSNFYKGVRARALHGPPRRGTADRRARRAQGRSDRGRGRCTSPTSPARRARS